MLVGVTLPVTSASCERSFSKMEPVKTFPRNSIDWVTLIYFHERVRAEKIDLDEFADEFDSRHDNRRIKLHPGLRSRSRSGSRKESALFGWSRSQIPNNTGSWSRIFCPTPDAQLAHFLHHTPKSRILVEMVRFLLKLLLNQRFLAVYHDLHWF